ncbi:MAG: CdaR family protein [Candidatus Limnocylindria bacterium]
MGFLLRNWHLKLSAVLLATVLYTGLVFSGSFTDDDVSVPVDATNQPPSSQVLSGDVGTVGVRYRTSNELAGTIGAQAFVATVDLSQYDMERAPEPQVLGIEVTSLIDGIEILSIEPETVRVAIDRIETRTVPVEVDAGVVPDGLEIDDPVVSQDEVQVRGAAAVIGLVDRVLARVRIDASAIDFNDAVSLVAVDVAGQEVGAGLIGIEPETVSVQIDVQETETTQTLPIRPDITGTPAAGFALTSLSIEPSLVTLRGLPDALSGIREVLTEPVSIDGASSNEEFETALVLPEGTRLADGADEFAVAVSVGIEPSVSSRTFLVGVVCAGAGDNACLPSIDQLTLTLSGPVDTLAGLDAGDVTPSLDATGLAPGTYDLEPSIGGLPDGVELLGIVPGTVSVTIEAPATPEPTPTPAP